jgi:hypothetical protein
LSIEPVELKWPDGVALVARWRVADGLRWAVSVAPAIGLAVATSIGLALGTELMAAVAEADGDPAGPPGMTPLGPVRQAAKPAPATNATVNVAATPIRMRGRAQVPGALRPRRAPMAAPTSFEARTESPGSIEP